MYRPLLPSGSLCVLRTPSLGRIIASESLNVRDMSQSSCKFLGVILLLCFSQVDSYPVWVNAKKMFDLKSAEAEALLKK